MQHHSQDPGYSASPQPEIRFWRMQHNLICTKNYTPKSHLKLYILMLSKIIMYFWGLAYYVISWSHIM
ncbi:hypothetical protein BpHYR1_016462 [Brachionus plicatilis]|uniref:Uncharacterized protein n=1 Tax=Brachionus plicatilis TaxID=10195 RepID=A0A3M7RZ23_BRAPC|nr:hypothetical protein BpHYR1_016462 [Brachionus plicatilis]